jgi:hypothetical protein
MAMNNTEVTRLLFVIHRASNECRMAAAMAEIEIKRGNIESSDLFRLEYGKWALVDREASDSLQKLLAAE